MTSPAVICPVTDIDVLITDDGVSDEAVKAFRSSDVQVVVV
jgi:DeoR family transcriptional regulator, aga operon transcriptional repressor